MPNYYYDAPPDFTPDETVEIVVPMEQPPEGVFEAFIDETYGRNAYFKYNEGVIDEETIWKVAKRALPYPLGARVGVREAWHRPIVHMIGKIWEPPSTMPNYAIRHWYAVTEVDVVNRKGQWVEKVTMRRET